MAVEEEDGADFSVAPIVEAAWRSHQQPTRILATSSRTPQEMHAERARKIRTLGQHEGGIVGDLAALVGVRRRDVQSGLVGKKTKIDSGEPNPATASTDGKRNDWIGGAVGEAAGEEEGDKIEGVLEEARYAAYFRQIPRIMR